MMKARKSLLADVLLILGAASLCYGCGLWYQPLAFVVAGGLLMGGGVILALGGGRT